jgi:hypothetical protein
MRLTTPESIVNTIGIDLLDLPTPINLDYLDRLIDEATASIEDKLGTTFLIEEEDEKETFEKIVSSRFMEGNRIARLQLKNISDIKVYEKSGYETSWRLLREKYDYDIDYDSALIIFHRDLFKLSPVTEFNNIKVTGKYGGETPTQAVKDLVRVLCAIQLLICLSGKDINENAVEGFTLGDFTQSVRPLRGSEGNIYFETLEKEKNRLIEEVGLINSERKIKFKVI